MTNTDNFDADVEQGGDEEFGDAPAEEAAAAPAAEPKKSGGGGIIVKLLVLLIVLAGGAAGAVKMGFVALPFDIPGLTPPAAVAAAPAAETPAAKPPVEMAQADRADKMVQPAAGADAAPPPQPAMNNIAPQSGEAAPAPGGANPMLPAPVSAAPQAAAAPPEEIKAPAAPTSAPPAAADIAAAPALTAPPAIAAPSISAPEMPAVTPPASTPAAPAMAPPATPAMTAPPPVETAPPVEAVAPPAVGSPEDAAKMQKLDDRVTALEQKIAEIADMKGSLATKADLDALKASLQEGMSAQAKNPAAVQAAGSEVAGYRHGKKPKTVKAPAAEAAAGVAPHKHMRGHKDAAAMMTGTSNWILKGAKPGTAWVAEPGSAEIRAVGVGETLKGLGKITSISQDSGGRWVVSGTRGRINQ